MVATRSAWMRSIAAMALKARTNAVHGRNKKEPLLKQRKERRKN